MSHSYGWHTKLLNPVLPTSNTLLFPSFENSKFENVSSCTAPCRGKLLTNGCHQLTNDAAVHLTDDSSSLSLMIFVISLSKALRAINTDSIKAEALTQSFVCISSIKWKCQLDVTCLILLVIFSKR